MKTQWFLVPKEIADLVVKTLLKCSEMVEYYAQGKITQIDSDVMYSKFIKNCLHDFETSLHITECIPDDFKEQNSDPEELNDLGEWFVKYGSIKS